ncbi:hypothetical protein DIPPA_03193 [Diplonema papillatum]|nr:hypothetical protein DIPPA_03193 [Diplonema papillatum]
MAGAESATAGAAADEQGAACCGKSAGVLLRMGGCAGSSALAVICVLDTLSLGFERLFLNAFMVLFCVICFLSEIRNTSCLQGVGYSVVKWMYLSTTYTGRGFLYMFLGSCNLDTGKFWRLTAALFLLGWGAVVLLAAVFLKDLPTYNDEAKMKAKRDARKKKTQKKGKQKESGAGEQAAAAEEGDIETGPPAGGPSLEVLYYGQTAKAPPAKTPVDEAKKEAKKQQLHRDAVINPFGATGAQYASSTAKTVAKNGDAGSVARAAAKGDTSAAASTAARSIASGPQQQPAAAKDPFAQASAPGAAHFTKYEVDDDEVGDDDDDDELERMYAQMKVAK